MASLGSSHPIVRLNFSKIEKIMDIPNLIDVQRQSYENFLQKDVSPEDRQDIGLQAVFKSVFPIRDFNETASLEFVSYSLGEPKYEVDECRQRGMTYAAPLKVVVRLITYEVDEEERKGRPARAGHQGAGSLFRRNSLDDRQGDLCHQRNREGDRQPAPPLSRNPI